MITFLWILTGVLATGLFIYAVNINKTKKHKP